MENTYNSTFLENTIKELKEENFRLKEELTNSSKNNDKYSSVNLLITALEAAANSVVITDTIGTIEWANKAFEILTGYTTKEVVGKNPKILNSGKNDKFLYKSLWNTITKGDVWQGEIINKKKDGSFYTEELTITPVKDSKNKVNHYIAIKQDITERKENEKLLTLNKTSVEEALIGIIWFDKNYRVLYANKSAEEILGYSKFEILNEELNKANLELLNSHFLKSKIQKLLVENKSEFETPIMKKNGVKIVINTWIRTLQYNNDKIFVANFRDITHKKIVREIEDLYNSNCDLQEFLEGMHCSIKKIINAPNLFIALLDKSTDIVSFPYFADLQDSKPKPRKQKNGLTEYAIKQKNQ